MRFDLETRYNDYDTAGHVNNAVYLTYFEVARVKAWNAMVGARQDVAFVIAEASVRYVSRAQLGEPLAIDIRTAEYSASTPPSARRIVRGRSTSGSYVAGTSSTRAAAKSVISGGSCSLNTTSRRRTSCPSSYRWSK